MMWTRCGVRWIHHHGAERCGGFETKAELSPEGTAAVWNER